MGILRFLISLFLKWLLSPFLFIYSSIRALMNREFNKYCDELAIAKDAYGNVSGQYFWNDVLITKKGYKFGNRKETISSVEGKNYENKTLTLLGWLLANDLDKIQKDHVINSIDNNIKD